MSSALALSHRLGCVGSYSTAREIHLVAGRNPNGTPADVVLEVLVIAFESAQLAVSNDNRRTA